MKLLKSQKFLLLTLLLSLIMVISLALGTYTVYARTVTIDGSNFFYANGGASVRAHKETSDETDYYYTMFHFTDDDNYVTYRYNLAYHWYQANEADDDGYIDYSTCEEGWFNMTVGFENDDFDRYVIKFQSQQYAKTEDAVTSNYVVFVSDGAGNVTVYVTDDEDETEATAPDTAKTFPVADSNGGVNRITIEFTAYNEGVYTVRVSDAAGSDAYTGEFLNIGNTYAKRVSSTTAAVMPLTFSATFDDDSSNKLCDMVLFTLNNQSFSLADGASVTDDDETYYTGTSVTDDCPPVLCLSGNLTYLEYGEVIDFDYVVIDVLASSPNSTIHYYVLSADIYNSAAASTETDYFVNDETDDNTGESLFDKTSSDDFLLIDSADPFLTSELVEANKNSDTGYTVGCLVKVYLELTDVTSTTNNNATTNVYLDWYIDSKYLASVTAGGNTSNFIMAVTDERGATYVSNYDENGDYVGTLDTLQDSYQAKVDEIAYDENGALTLSAGSTSYFYLPSYEGFISDNFDGYEDLTYYIYYTVDGSENSASSLSYNDLSITLSSAGTYKFTVYATDSNSNSMYYIDADGELVEFTSSEIYDDEVQDYIPWFTFTVIYNGATVEDPGEQTTGYVDTTYSVSSFEINGVSSYYETSYSLYRFDRTAFADETGISLSYSDFVENAEALFTNTYLVGSNGEYENTRQYFTTIKALDDLNETDEDYDDYCDYEWDPDALTFVPQDENAFYLIRLTVTDTYIHQAAVYSYMGIHVSAAAESYSGESDWVANNVASIVLFSIAGAALIGIILLIVIKPKDGGDIDEQLANELNESNKAQKTKKSKKNKAE